MIESYQEMIEKSIPSEKGWDCQDRSESGVYIYDPFFYIKFYFVKIAVRHYSRLDAANLRPLPRCDVADSYGCSYILSEKAIRGT